MTPDWTPPTPLGQPEGIQTAGGVAAPLLAGFSLTTLTFVLTDLNARGKPHVRWPELVLLFLTIATVLLVMTVQCAANARRYQITPGDVRTWYGDEVTPLFLLGCLTSHLRENAKWSRLTRYTYNAGVLCLLVALPLILLPAGDPSVGRVAVVAVAVIGPLIEIIWLVFDWRAGRADQPARQAETSRLGHDRQEPSTPLPDAGAGAQVGPYVITAADQAAARELLAIVGSTREQGVGQVTKC